MIEKIKGGVQENEVRSKKKMVKGEETSMGRRVTYIRLGWGGFTLWGKVGGLGMAKDWRRGKGGGDSGGGVRFPGQRWLFGEKTKVTKKKGHWGGQGKGDVEGGPVKRERITKTRSDNRGRRREMVTEFTARDKIFIKNTSRKKKVFINSKREMEKLSKLQ